ncbi:alpha/beta hydrolase family esterase [Flavivirga algicola]|uniref:Prolyl oligopeptidase family serine peptidase n=1 Tax=Flavivirga algicola TaxID=2729136 RepID=A0ABX1RZS7_9FLAO|nr:PHB depolymerase family esterase [Flavivirga algicola]NMH89087.1 prolyl oligopeptidase family serine peptidase [Flavivirga algicola]
MKKAVFSLLCFITFLVSAQETVSGTMLHDDTERIHKIYIPSSYTIEKPAPLLLLIHGYSEPAGWILEYTKFQPLAEKYGFIIACPEGKINRAKVPAWDFSSTNEKGEIKDVDYINSFMDKLINDYSIDKKRIYITGFSQGGYMSFIAGCHLNNRIAAIAPVSGAMPVSSLFKCAPVHSTPAIVINGDNDNAVPYNGNRFGKSVKESLNFWIDYNKCDKIPVITSVEDQNPADEQTVEKHEFLNGENHSKIVHYKVVGGTHLWPGREGNTSFEATPIIWKFFSQFKLE